MPLTYLDSSALVKRYVAEAGSSRVIRLCDEEPIVISQLAIAEIASALARRAHEGAFRRERRDELFRAFVADAKSWLIMDLHKPVVQRAAALLLDAPVDLRLRALDALHVASADLAFRRARRRGLEVGHFVASDTTLLSAARWVGLATEDPSV